MKTPPLPPKWSYKKPWLTDNEGYSRYVLDQAGRLDRMRVAQILENHGHQDYAAAWRGQDLTPLQLAAPELLELVTLALPYVEEGEEFNHPTRRNLSKRIRDAIAQATQPQ